MSFKLYHLTKTHEYQCATVHEQCRNGTERAKVNSGKVFRDCVKKKVWSVSFFPVKNVLSFVRIPLSNTVKPRYSAPALNIIPPIEYTNFSSNKCLHSYLYIGDKQNLGIKNDIDQSIEIRYSGVKLYLHFFGKKKHEIITEGRREPTDLF